MDSDQSLLGAQIPMGPMIPENALASGPLRADDSGFVLVIGCQKKSMAGQYLEGPRSPKKVKRYGYGFTNDPAKAWPFASQPQANAKALIVDRHMGWGEGVLVAEPNSKKAKCKLDSESCFLPVVETLNKLPEVTWDRFAGDGVENVSVYGWLPRDDGRSDFVLVMIDKDGPWLISTSSAKHSADFSARLGMDSDGHSGCRRVEDHFPGVRCVRLKES
jgi:hypothetical protein